MRRMALFGSDRTDDDPRATSIRTCGKCRADAVVCHHVTVHYVNGLPAGRTYSHKCQQCGRLFTTISTWRTIRDAGFSALSALFGAIMIPLGTARILDVGLSGASGGDWLLFAMGWLLGLFGVGLGLSITVKTYRLFENPVSARARPPARP
jgi:hypothetical protein